MSQSYTALVAVLFHRRGEWDFHPYSYTLILILSLVALLSLRRRPIDEIPRLLWALVIVLMPSSVPSSTSLCVPKICPPIYGRVFDRRRVWQSSSNMQTISMQRQRTCWPLGSSMRRGELYRIKHPSSFTTHKGGARPAPRLTCPGPCWIDRLVCSIPTANRP